MQRQCVSWAASGQGQAQGSGLEGKNSWELRVGWRSRPSKDIQGQLGVGEDFQQGWRKWDLPLKHHGQ